MRYRIRYAHNHDTDSDGRPVVRTGKLPLSDKPIEWIGVTDCIIEKQIADFEGEEVWQEISEGMAICLKGDNFCKADGRKHSFDKAIRGVPHDVKNHIIGLYFTKAKSVNIPEEA